MKWRSPKVWMSLFLETELPWEPFWFQHFSYRLRPDLGSGRFRSYIHPDFARDMRDAAASLLPELWEETGFVGPSSGYLTRDT